MMKRWIILVAGAALAIAAVYMVRKNQEAVESGPSAPALITPTAAPDIDPPAAAPSAAPSAAASDDPRAALISQEPMFVLTAGDPASDDLIGKTGLALLLEGETISKWGLGVAQTPANGLGSAQILFPAPLDAPLDAPRCEIVLTAETAPNGAQMFAGPLICTFPNGTIAPQLVLDPSGPFAVFAPGSVRTSGDFAEAPIGLTPEGEFRVGALTMAVSAHRLIAVHTSAVTSDMPPPPTVLLQSPNIAARLGLALSTESPAQAVFPYFNWRGAVAFSE